MLPFLRRVALSALLMTLAFASTTTNAFDYFGFTLGMSEADAIALANRSGYKLQPTSQGSYIFTSGDSGPDSISFCDGKLFGIAHTFDGDFPMFIGLVQQRQARLGEPFWKVEQGYATGVQPVKQLSQLTAQWDDPVERLQSMVTLLSYGKSLRITEAYNAHTYLCRRP
jgi:hypothetical protein